MPLDLRGLRGASLLAPTMAKKPHSIGHHHITNNIIVTSSLWLIIQQLDIINNKPP